MATYGKYMFVMGEESIKDMSLKLHYLIGEWWYG